VLQRLSNAGLKVKVSKCQFAQREVRYLGHIVSAEGIQPDPVKLGTVVTYPVPKDVGELRRFLGLANYYYQYVKDYSWTAKPLHKLTRKTSSGFQWNEICQQAFELLKEHLLIPPILAYQQFDRPFILYTDASEGAIGAVLSQMENGRERIIAYWSQQLTKAECNYSTIEREALAIVVAAKEFCPYLYLFHFKVVIDHTGNPLTSQRKLRDVRGRLTRWRLFLHQLDYEVEYRAGVKNGNADALSRWPDNKTDAVVATLQSLWSFGDLDEIRREQENDPYLSTVMEAVCNGTPPPGLTRQQKGFPYSREYCAACSGNQQVHLRSPRYLFHANSDREFWKS